MSFSTQPRRSPLAASLSSTSRQTAIASGRKHKPDYLIILISVVLLTIGLIVIYSIGPALAAIRGEGGGSYFVTRQLMAIFLGLIAFFVTSRVPLKMWRRWQWLLLMGAMIGTLIALLTPVVPAYPAHRWIRLGGFSLQSVEVLKFALLIAVSGFLAVQAKRGELSSKTTFLPLMIVLGVLGVVVGVVQSDFGSMMVIIAMMVVVAIVAGLPLKKIGIIVLIVASMGVLLVTSTPYRRDRVMSFMNPEAHCQTTGYQACQALVAIGSGGVAGLGIGQGAQAYGYLPEAQNDSIFAIYAEKFGFVGSMTLLGLFGVLFARMSRIAERAPTMFSRLIVVGVLTWLSTQTIINIGAMIGILPLKGITLPLISYGGTSVLFVGAALGLVFQISKYTSFSTRIAPRAGKGGKNEGRYDGRRVGRTYNSDLGRRTRG